MQTFRKVHFPVQNLHFEMPRLNQDHFRLYLKSHHLYVSLVGLHRYCTKEVQSITVQVWTLYSKGVREGRWQHFYRTFTRKRETTNKPKRYKWWESTYKYSTINWREFRLQVLYIHIYIYTYILYIHILHMYLKLFSCYSSACTCDVKLIFMSFLDIFIEKIIFKL